MCGLVGMAGDGIVAEDHAVFSTLMKLSQFRGQDSTGLFIADPLNHRDQHMVMDKKVMQPWDYIEMDARRKTPMINKNFQSSLFMGHTRWATVGRVDLDGAHPFDTGRYVGAHNGTLVDPWSYHKHKSDSLLMFERMEEKGIKPVLEELAYDSAFAVSIYDKETRRLYLVRNTHRTLWIGIHNKRDVLYWVSDDYYFDWCEHKIGVEMTQFKTIPGMIYELDISLIKAGEESPYLSTEEINLPPKPKQQSRRGATAPILASPTPVKPAIAYKPQSISVDMMFNHTDNQDEEEAPWWDVEDCCICARHLSVAEVKALKPVDVDGTNYYVCTECENAQKTRIREVLDEEAEDRGQHREGVQLH